MKLEEDSGCFVGKSNVLEVAKASCQALEHRQIGLAPAHVQLGQ